MTRPSEGRPRRAGPGDALGLIAGAVLLQLAAWWLTSVQGGDEVAFGTVQWILLGCSLMLALVVVVFRRRIFPHAPAAPLPEEVTRFARIVGAFASLSVVALAVVLLLPILFVLWGLGTIWR